jgi:hypothetical protein
MPLIRDKDIGIERVEFDNGDWYELRKALGHFHRMLVSEISAITVHLPGSRFKGQVDSLIDDRATIPATMEATAHVNNRRLLAYVRKWSHADPITEENCKFIPPDHAHELLRVIARLQRAQDGPDEMSPLGKGFTSRSAPLSDKDGPDRT